MKKNQTERELEWEGAAEPIHVDRVELPHPFLPGTEKLSIHRDQDMQLQLVAEGKLSQHYELAERVQADRQIPAGTLTPSSKIDFEAYGVKYELEMHISSVPGITTSSADPGGARFSQTGTVIRLINRMEREMVQHSRSRDAKLGAAGSRSLAIRLVHKWPTRDSIHACHQKIETGFLHP